MNRPDGAASPAGGPVVRQLLAGRDFARADAAAGQMANFVYLIGDPATRDCVLVDPAWDVAGLVAVVEEAGFRLCGALATHYHPDHVGGSMFGFRVEGLARLLELRGVKVWVNAAEADGVKQVTGLQDSDLVKVHGGDSMRVGGFDLTLLHTPGHTPGSQCFLVGGHLVAGDTLFVRGCGRVDLPGGDPEQMYESLKRLAALPDDTVLCPGHDYGDRPTSLLAEERRQNPYLMARSLDAWRRMMGGA
jgi:glyoxylase-like metal-dependent hydrolase (beta-lactamase superfamily II)